MAPTIPWDSRLLDKTSASCSTCGGAEGKHQQATNIKMKISCLSGPASKEPYAVIAGQQQATVLMFSAVCK
jgi:hypothetical protein